MSEASALHASASRCAAIGRSRQRGVTLVELLIATAISALLLMALLGVLDQADRARALARERADLTRQAEFAMRRMIAAVEQSPHLLLPLPDNPGTDWPEHIREQTIPASPPIGSSTLATAVLAVTSGAGQDLDLDGTADADRDGDGRQDEDPDSDMTEDDAAGIFGLDDDGDGQVDEGSVVDDDEDGLDDEDIANGLDDDGDGAVDEDSPRDRNGDNEPGEAGIDDDGDGEVDEGDRKDDDEDGSADEDGPDPVVFYLNGSTLVERTPVPWDESGDGGVDGLDFVEGAIAEHVARFRVERVADGGLRAPLVDLTLELAGPGSERVSVQTRVRVGGAP